MYVFPCICGTECGFLHIDMSCPIHGVGEFREIGVQYFEREWWREWCRMWRYIAGDIVWRHMYATATKGNGT